jgi:hypothetical protein
MNNDKDQEGVYMHTKMKCRLLLDVVVRQRASVLELLAGEDKALLIRRDALLVLNLRFHVINRVRGLDLESDRLPREGLDEDLHAAAETEHEVKGRLLLDVIVGERATVLELLSGEDEALLVGRDAARDGSVSCSLVSSEAERTPPCPGSWP